MFWNQSDYIKGVPKNQFFWNMHFLPKTFFIITKLFGCQRKSFRDGTKENFDTCPRSEGLIITELCHFLWDQIMLRQHKVRLKIVKKWMSKMLVSTKNVISQWICVLQTWDRCRGKKFLHLNCLPWHGLKKMGLTENGITQWLWVFQTWDRCHNFPWFNT